MSKKDLEKDKTVEEEFIESFDKFDAVSSSLNPMIDHFGSFFVLAKTLKEVSYRENRQLFLTGSRFFECENPNSDWNFFTQETPNSTRFKQELLSLGFHKEDLTNYKDNLVMEIYRHLWMQIDIQFVSNAKIKFKAQKLLKAKGHKRPTNQQWNNAFDLIKVAEELRKLGVLD